MHATSKILPLSFLKACRLSSVVEFVLAATGSLRGQRRIALLGELLDLSLLLDDCIDGGALLCLGDVSLGAASSSLSATISVSSSTLCTPLDVFALALASTLAMPTTSL